MITDHGYVLYSEIWTESTRFFFFFLEFILGTQDYLLVLSILFLFISVKKNSDVRNCIKRFTKEMDLSVILYLINYEQIRKLHWNWLHWGFTFWSGCNAKKNINVFLVNLKMEVLCFFAALCFFRVDVFSSALYFFRCYGLSQASWAHFSVKWSWTCKGALKTHNSMIPSSKWSNDAKCATAMDLYWRRLLMINYTRGACE